MATAALANLDKAGAQDIARRLQAAAQLWRNSQEEADRHATTVGSLLEEAMERQAHRADGVGSFPDWASTALGVVLSRQQMHRLQVHVRQLRSISEAGGVGIADIADTPERVTRDLRQRLPEVTEEVARRTADVPPEDRPGVVREVMLEQRQQVADGLPVPHDPRAEAEGRAARVAATSDLARLYAAIDLLAGLPDPELVALMVPEDEMHRLRALPKAAARLGALAAAWERRESAE